MDTENSQNEQPEQPVQLPQTVNPVSSNLSSSAILDFFRSYFKQARLIILHPKNFLFSLPDDPNLIEPSLFLVATAAIYALLQAIGHLSPLSFFMFFFTSIIKTALGAFLVQFVLAKLGGQGKINSTYAILAYCKAPLLFAWISVGPLQIGGIAALLYTTYLNVIGFRHIHPQIDRTKLITAVVAMSAIASLFH